MKWNNPYTTTHNLASTIKHIIIFLFICLSCSCFSGSFTSENSKLPITFTSNKLYLYKTNSNIKSVYEGNATFSQGHTRLIGEKITIYTNENKISKIIAESRGAEEKRASFEDYVDNETGYIKIWGGLLEYDIVGRILHAKKNAELRRNSDNMPTLDNTSHDKISAAIITYDMKTDKATAERSQSQNTTNENDRVIMVINPEQSIITSTKKKKKSQPRKK